MMEKHLVFGILAHVDAGKTTLSEAILYKTGAIRKMGRVDHRNTFLDSDSIERDRGITVFSKEARFSLGDVKAVMLDTPGHSDFSTEAERTLRVLDCAILVISGPDGIQSHTVTLWKLLKMYRIPVIVFVNKMDRPETSACDTLKQLADEFGEGFVAFEDGFPADMEDAAVCSEELMEEYLQCGEVTSESVKEAVMERKLFPVCFGSALKMTGIDELLTVLEKNVCQCEYPDHFAARVFKISHDKQGNRLTHMKLTGGSLKVRDVISTEEDCEGDCGSGEKADQIRLYSGETFQTAAVVYAGDICAVTGLKKTYAGQGLGGENAKIETVIEPSMTYRMILPDGTDPSLAMQKLARLNEEDPALDIFWDETSGAIHVKVMGSLELEILERVIREKLGIKVTFGEGSVIYKETIAEPVIGIGHFEPLRHYAEVHLLMEPLPAGSGIVAETAVSEDKLDRNWQRLILSHILERSHPGVLIGAPVTDMRITLVAARAHLKHTEGGDFRQATYRAIRQGLRKGKSVLLEPMVTFKASVPDESSGRLMSDLKREGADFSVISSGQAGKTLIEGRGCASALGEYPSRISAYTKGAGTFSAIFDRYGPCPRQEAVVTESGYNPDSDIMNPTGSIFCSGGSGTYVSWDKVDEAAHIKQEEKTDRYSEPEPDRSSIAETAKDELEAIFFRTYGKSKRDEALRRERLSSAARRPAKPMETALPRLIKKGNEKNPEIIIVDGYNVIYGWEELKELAVINLDSARESLIEILQNFGTYIGIKIIVIFDGYKLSKNPGTVVKYDGLDAVFTKEAQTADSYIEEMVYRMGKSYRISVVTSDMPVQMAALGDGALRISAREFYSHVTEVSEEIRKKLNNMKK